MAGRSGPACDSTSEPAAIVSLVRPQNGAIAAAAVLVGAHLSAHSLHVGPALLGAASAFAAASGANAFNDFVDREADRVNRPDRPIPSGRTRPAAALRLAAAAYVVCLVLAAFVSPSALGLAGAWVVATIVYSRFLSGVQLLGNVVVAVVASSPFLMGGISQARIEPSLVPAGLAFLVHLAREVVKDGEDREGDAAAGVRTFAVAAGPLATLALARLVAVLLMVAALLPFAYRLYGWWYLGVVAVAEAILAWRFVIAPPEATREGFGRLSLALKAVMLVGLAAIAVGTV